MSTVEFDGPPSWSLGGSETGESTQCTYQPHHIYPRAFCTLPSFARITRPRWRSVKLNDRHLRFHSLGSQATSALGGFYVGLLSWFFMRLLRRRQRGRVVRAPDLKSRSLGFKSNSDHYKQDQQLLSWSNWNLECWFLLYFADECWLW